MIISGKPYLIFLGYCVIITFFGTILSYEVNCEICLCIHWPTQPSEHFFRKNQRLPTLALKRITPYFRSEFFIVAGYHTECITIDSASFHPRDTLFTKAQQHCSVPPTGQPILDWTVCLPPVRARVVVYAESDVMWFPLPEVSCTCKKLDTFKCSGMLYAWSSQTMVWLDYIKFCLSIYI